MPRYWRKADRDLRCGYDWCHIPKGTPYQEIRLKGVNGVYVRCEQHADGSAPADLGEIESKSAVLHPFRAPAAFKRLTDGVQFDPKMRAAGEDDL